jgi:hypothetical protein
MVLRSLNRKDYFLGYINDLVESLSVAKIILEQILAFLFQL